MTVTLPRNPSPVSGSGEEELGWLRLCSSNGEEAKGSLGGAIPFHGSLMAISQLPLKTGAKYFSLCIKQNLNFPLKEYSGKLCFSKYTSFQTVK